MQVSRNRGGYIVFFDTEYFERAEQPFPMPPSCIQEPSDVFAWILALPWLKQVMDIFLGRHGKSEREIQQLLLRDNNVAGCARSTDYYVCDIEYASENGRFDLVAVRWPSTSADRKRQDGHCLVVAEVKQGDCALEGAAGLHAHINDVNAHLADPGNLARLKREMVGVFNQKRALGFIDCEKDLKGFSDERPLLLLVLVNHDPAKSRLRELLRSLPPSPHAELRIATGSLLGYGLYDPAILTLEQAFLRFGECI
jgi:hypothetical protein